MIFNKLIFLHIPKTAGSSIRNTLKEKFKVIYEGTHEDYIKIGTPLIIKDKSTKNNIFLAIAHDKGSAIKGEFRIDLFTGFGKRAEKKAAMLKRNIEVFPLHLRKF